MRSRFEDIYGRPTQRTWFAPGRVNIIGEHTDYNDGFALPIALPLGVRADVAAVADGTARVSSVQHPGEVVSARIEDLSPGCVDGWAGYAMGVLWALRQEGHQLPGVDVLIDGDVPVGAGLSSSAALECAVATAVDDLFGLGCGSDSLIRIARRAENDFVGVPTGALDQTASMQCRRDRALFVDFRSMQTRAVPLQLDQAGLVLLVIDTQAPHQLVDGEYAARRADCARAAHALGVASLREVASADLPAALTTLAEPVLRRRVNHVVTENARVTQAVESLDSGKDPRELGSLLTASHVSLRDDYAVSCPELDLAVDTALAAGAHGARMTGGGFGGSAIALVDQLNVGAVTAAVSRAFHQRGFTPPVVFTVHPAPGAHRLQD